VHRSTFYEHAASPGDLLRQALLADLDALRADLLSAPEADTDEAVAAATRRVLEHVREHAPIYRRGLGPDSGPAGLDGMLGDHFLESSRQLLRAGRLHLPLEVEGLPDEVVADIAARFVARATVGAIQGWLGLPGEPDVAVFGALYAALLPAWWVQQ
jgi:AcrR family transcriptional regulator